MFWRQSRYIGTYDAICRILLVQNGDKYLSFQHESRFCAHRHRRRFFVTTERLLIAIEVFLPPPDLPACHFAHCITRFVDDEGGKVAPFVQSFDITKVKNLDY